MKKNTPFTPIQEKQLEDIVGGTANPATVDFTYIYGTGSYRDSKTSRDLGESIALTG